MIYFCYSLFLVGLFVYVAAIRRDHKRALVVGTAMMVSSLMIAAVREMLR
jgi:hypothetical protein